MKIVADTGPLITWSLVDQVPLLRQLVGTVVIPGAVADELTAGGTRPGASLPGEDWVEVRRLEKDSAQPFPAVLGRGEREAIQLAQQLDLPLLADDGRARREAENRGLEVYSTLRLLAQAKRHGLIRTVQPILEKMRATGFWLAPPVAQEFLAANDETL